MKLFGRNLILTADQTTPVVVRAGMRPQDIGPQWPHIAALPAL